MGELKISDTMYRVCGLFLQMLENQMSFEDMFEYFNKVAKTPIFSKEVLNKYLNTLRAVGLIIERLKGGKYYLYNFLTAVKLTEEEISAFKKMEVAVLKYGSANDITTFIDLKRKIEKFFDKETQDKLNVINISDFKTEITFKIKFFQDLCEDGQKIKIKYEKDFYIIEPRQILFEDNMLYLEGFNTIQSKITKFILNKITFIEQQPSKNTNITSNTSVLFELSGKLAHTYKLKEGESIIAEHPTKIFVKSITNDYEFLAKRLIRYQKFCKIIKPLDFKEYFIKYTDKILDLYKEEL